MESSVLSSDTICPIIEKHTLGTATNFRGACFLVSQKPDAEMAQARSSKTLYLNYGSSVLIYHANAEDIESRSVIQASKVNKACEIWVKYGQYESPDKPRKY
jgi:hypothetical protein